jgi:putative transposase
MGSTKRYAGLKLTEADRKDLRQREAAGERMTARTWRRIQVLLLLDRGLSVRAAATALLRYPREVSRVGRRYLQGGLEHALSDDPRPKPSRMLDSGQEAAIVAMVCGPVPEGRATWSTTLIAAEAMRRGIVPRVGRETIRMVLSRHQLKPWREKNVVRARDRRGVR